MSINSPFKKGGAKLASTESSSPTEAAAITKEELIRGDLKVWLLLLLIICLAGSGSLAFSVLPSSLLSNSSASPAYTDGVCVAQPTDIHYLANTSSSPGTTNSVLSTWSQTGKTQQDLDNAQACAASFTLAYESYTADDLKSLEASVSILSAGAKKRFYTPDPQALVKRMDPMWRADFQKRHLIRTAQVQQSSVLHIQRANGRILVWITVPYVFTVKTNSDTYAPQSASLTTLLVSAPTSITSGTGWQVSGWNDHPNMLLPQYPL